MQRNEIQSHPRRVGMTMRPMPKINLANELKGCTADRSTAINIYHQTPNKLWFN